MIYKRFAANLRAQNWFAIGIELAIVVLGVFIGTWVANWNAQRMDRVETRRMLVQLEPSIDLLQQYFESARRYYAVTRGYAAVAQAGWMRDPSVSDSDFVIAAYQASQIMGIGTNGSAWAGVLGADRLRQIENVRLRTDLATLMSSDYSIIDTPAVDTPYMLTVGVTESNGALLKARDLLAAQPYVRQAQNNDDSVLRLVVDEGEAALPDVLRLLDGAGVGIRTVAMARPSLDEVFLNATGRSLRDSAN